jgi:intracellular sulfur oxidation DsrE/DsrF family protein
VTKRREFLAQLGAVAAMGAVAEEAGAARAPVVRSEWDTSWLDRLASAKHRVVFNGNVIDDGGVLSYAQAFLDGFHEVHNTDDAQTRPVIVFRRLGTPMAFGDSVWERYPIADDAKINDPATKALARRNPFWKAAPGQNGVPTIEGLNQRGLISLVCSVSVGSWSRGLAKATQRNVDEVVKDLKANLVPGAILVPSGIYALIRAQNAGCAFMLGT